MDIIKIPTGASIVREHEHTYDARQVLLDLRTYIQGSITGTFLLQEQRSELLNMRCDSHWKKTHSEFLLTWDYRLSSYNKQQRTPTYIIGPELAKEFLSTAFDPAPHLAIVRTREDEDQLRGAKP